MPFKLPEAKEILKNIYQKSPVFWRQRQKIQALKLFSLAAKSVPAYKDFLKQNSIPPGQIKTFEDFQTLPAINKKNYFSGHSLNDVVISNAYYTDPLVMTSTSGSTGKPAYFPRRELLDWQYSVWAEFFLNNGPDGNTLLIDCFGMGVWIGGLITYQAFRICALRGYPLTIITPGINKKEVFHALRELAPQFNSVILAGYPPFIKDLLDEASEEKINFKKFRTRLLFAAEGFTENFREHLAQRVGIKNLYNDTLNIYGSAELGAMAIETPLSILVRRLALGHPEIFSQLFIKQKLPTLAQYNPLFASFEAPRGQILITANNACPLIRYQIGDTGAVYGYDVISRIFSAAGFNLDGEAKKQKIRLTRLPFVAVYERNDFSTKLYGAIIYPEHVREALQNDKLAKNITGKFTMATRSDKRHNQFLEINIELARLKTANKKIEKLCRDLIVKNLLVKNAEYKNNHQTMAKKILPKILLKPHGQAPYFVSGIKQRWTITK